MNEIVGFFSILVGVVGLLYGWIKDRELKQIHQRASAPYFKFDTFALDSSSKSSPQGGQPWYSYRKSPSELNGDLFSMDEYKPSLPSNYPDDLVLGIELLNTGTPIRSFSIKSKEHIFFKHYRKSEFSLRYFFKRSEIGNKLFFTIIFETVDGVQEKQKWLHIKGEKTIVRVKPKSVIT